MKERFFTCDRSDYREERIDMEIGILTWYKSLNHGAVLQAYAMQRYLISKGIYADLIDYDRQVKDQRSALVLASQRLKKLVNGELKDRNKIYQMDVNKRELFNRFIKEELDCCEIYSKVELNHIIIGSDMVFSLIQGFNPYMFGLGLNTQHVFSYAASAGGTQISLARKMGVEDSIKSGLSRFSSIGYRDKETLEFINSMNLDLDCCENIDPVLLYGFEEEKTKWDSQIWIEHDPYILIYAYHGFMNDKTEVQAIRQYAKLKGLKIISCGYHHSWCDENVNADPKEFLEMFMHASRVVTDTFHGTVFSIINKKHFVSIIRDNGFKVRYLLETCGLRNRIACTGSEIGELLNQNFSFDMCDQWLLNERKKSETFLLQELK